MNSLTVSPNNGATAIGSPQSWLQLSVQKFFSTVNWDDNPPEMQEIKFTSQVSSGPLSLTLSVSQFLAAFHWDGTTIAAAPAQPSVPAPPARDLTLEDFSNLF
jgi:hypothetical protein